MRVLIVVLMCIGALGACSWNRRLEPVAAVAEPAEPDPFDETPASFVVTGPRFTPGETAIIKVCVSPEGGIDSADIVESSGDKRFDDFALVWARQVKLGNMPQGDAAKEICRAVRVEIKVSPSPRVLSGADNSLG